MLIVANRQTYPEDHHYDRSHGTDRYTLELTYSGTMLRRSGSDRRFCAQPNSTLDPDAAFGTIQSARPGRRRRDLVGLDPPAKLMGCLDWPSGDFAVPQLHIPPTPLGRQVLQALEDTEHFMSGRMTRRQQLAES